MYESVSFLFWLYTIGTEEERDIQKSYWMEHSSDLTVEAMMLDSKASDLDKEERPEVCETVVASLVSNELRLGICELMCCFAI